jgi:hypothetical protein
MKTSKRRLRKQKKTVRKQRGGAVDFDALKSTFSKASILFTNILNGIETCPVNCYDHFKQMEDKGNARNGTANESNKMKEDKPLYEYANLCNQQVPQTSIATVPSPMGRRYGTQIKEMPSNCNTLLKNIQSFTQLHDQMQLISNEQGALLNPIIKAMQNTIQHFFKIIKQSTSNNDNSSVITTNSGSTGDPTSISP